MQPIRLDVPDSFDADVQIPGSKSFTNRALILGALANGDTIIRNAAVCDDTLHMIGNLQQLGIACQLDRETCKVRIEGCAGNLPNVVGTFQFGMAGTPIRFFTALVSRGIGKAILTGSERMQKRPLRDLLDALTPSGMSVRYTGCPGCPPVEVTPSGCDGGAFTVSGKVSSQFVSALLLVYGSASGPASIRVVGKGVSKTYVEMTLQTLARFGVNLDCNRDEHGMTWSNGTGTCLRGATYDVEPDATGAGYFMALAAITGGRITIRDLHSSSLQGDVRLATILEEMGCRLEETKRGMVITGGTLRGVDIDMNSLPDSVQTLAVVAMFAEGPTRIRNVANLRVKETDRILAMEREVARLGGVCNTGPDWLEIVPQPVYASAAIECYHDHRMAMSFAPAAARIPGLVITDPGCVSKSFPAYFDLLSAMGVKTEPI